MEADEEMKEILKIKHNETLLAVIIPHDYDQLGITFCTSGDLSQQLAYMHHPDGHVIAPHVHNVVKREVQYTKETLVLRKGKLRVDFYDDAHCYIESCILEAGDVILLASGGHGFKVLEEVEMIEVKQGPYAGEGDKTRFEGVSDDEVRYVR